MVSEINQTPKALRLHIGVFGDTNAGKSTFINAVTGQNIALTSPVAGTTTDPVFKPMELLPLGPVVFIDTAGLDDKSELGQIRVEKSMEQKQQRCVFHYSLYGVSYGPALRKREPAASVNRQARHCCAWVCRFRLRVVWSTAPSNRSTSRCRGGGCLFPTKEISHTATHR